MVVHGEAGVGKTRLVREVCGALGAEIQVLWGTCVHFGEASVPFAPVIGALQSWLAQVNAQERAEVLSGAGELGRVLPALAGAHSAESGRLLPLIDLVVNRIAAHWPTVSPAARPTSRCWPAWPPNTVSNPRCLPARSRSTT